MKKSIFFIALLTCTGLGLHAAPQKKSAPASKTAGKKTLRDRLNQQAQLEEKQKQQEEEIRKAQEEIRKAQEEAKKQQEEELQKLAEKKKRREENQKRWQEEMQKAQEEQAKLTQLGIQKYGALTNAIKTMLNNETFRNELKASLKNAFSKGFNEAKFTQDQRDAAKELLKSFQAIIDQDIQGKEVDPALIESAQNGAMSFTLAMQDTMPPSQENVKTVVDYSSLLLNAIIEAASETAK
ncbi:MAG: hypothetical protein NTX86_04120 [Candidatus Dependentiae bacterium]|nr:hypothetical protein [Candidatus Dependentiae bacterium]